MHACMETVVGADVCNLQLQVGKPCPAWDLVNGPNLYRNHAQVLKSMSKGRTYGANVPRVH